MSEAGENKLSPAETNAGDAFQLPEYFLYSAVTPIMSPGFQLTNTVKSDKILTKLTLLFHTSLGLSPVLRHTLVVLTTGSLFLAASSCCSGAAAVVLEVFLTWPSILSGCLRRWMWQ